jgi:NADH:ubiquinone oxidoreductase subunit 5 (subunit L)/multisubunit Na+/H+ antiporter MnhA subunit
VGAFTAGLTAYYMTRQVWLTFFGTPRWAEETHEPTGTGATEPEPVAEHARKTVGAQDIWSRASTLHALGLVRAAQGRQEEAETLLRESLAIIEPTMYRRFADDVRESLEKIASRPAPATAPAP